MSGEPDAPDRCDECGFVYDVEPDETATRIVAAASGIAALLDRYAATAAARPSDEHWSMVEYAAHVRDVLIIVRDRMVVGLVEHDPSFSPAYRDERLSLGLYAGDPPAEVAAEVRAAASMLARFVVRTPNDGRARPVRFGYPDPVERTVGWMGVHALHEAEHHLGDIRELAEGSPFDR